MYHDQALIPIKTLAFEDAVNVTLGLPFIRTSPDHGTAFDIAGTGQRQSVEPDRGVAARRAHGGGQAWHERDRRPAAAARRHSRTRPVGAQIARPEFPARPQPHRADRARRGPARRRHRHRGRPRSRRADARAAGARRAARHRGRARRARAGRRSTRSRSDIPAGWRSSAPTRSVSIRVRCSAAQRAKIVANLPYNIATALAGRLALDRALAALVRHDGADVSARGRRAHRRARERRGLWPARRARELARRDQDPVRHFAGRLRAAAEGHLVGGAAGAAQRAGAVRSPGAGAGRGGRLRPAPQNAAAEPEIAGGRSGPAGRGRRGRCDPARRNHSGLRLCCHGPRIDRYTKRQNQTFPEEKTPWR